MRAFGSLAGLVPSVAVALAACVADARPGADGWAGSVDTLANGRVVVRNAAASLVAARLEERFRLGSLDGEGPELFGGIDGVALGPEGEVYVLDGQAAELRVFDGDGTHVHTIGRQGEGPGELDRASGLALDGSGTVWVLNWGNGRYSGFDAASGVVLREVLRPIAFATFPWQGGFQHGDRLVDVGLDLAGEIAVMRFDTSFPSTPCRCPNPTRPIGSCSCGGRPWWPPSWSRSRRSRPGHHVREAGWSSVRDERTGCIAWTSRGTRL